MARGIRKALLAGAWYPASARQLRAQIEAWAKELPLEKKGMGGDLLALVTPHAGIAYSGPVAAMAWKAASGRHYDAVILIGPSHRVRFRGAAISDTSGYESPLGVLPVDNDLADLLIENGSGLQRISDEGVPENSLELQVPFIQVLLPRIPFVPIMMGTQDGETCEDLATAIVNSTRNRRVLVAASSDFSHYHAYDNAVKIDGKALAYIERGDRVGFLRAVETGSCEACGAGPIVVAMTVAEAWGCDGIRILGYANSGDITGDKTGVVGYAAIGFFRSETKEEKKDGSGLFSAGEGSSGSLTEAEKRELLSIARKSIEDVFRGGFSERVFYDVGRRKELPETLKKPRGAFVTLKKHGMLRGCIGFIQPTRPLCDVVADVARAAAFDDPRFPPLRSKELEDVKIEISVLSPLRQIEDINEIEVGRHGLYIAKGSKAGLLLPQVATENGWDRLTFLHETCRKAGLPGDAWRDRDTAIYIFSAEVFGEDD